MGKYSEYSGFGIDIGNQTHMYQIQSEMQEIKDLFKAPVAAGAIE